MGLPAPHTSLDVLHLAECSLRDCLMVMGLHRVLANEPVEVEFRMAEVRMFEGRGSSAEENLEALHLAHARVNQLMDEYASFCAGTEQAMAEWDTLIALTRELEVAAATRHGDLALGCGPAVFKRSYCSGRGYDKY